VLVSQLVNGYNMIQISEARQQVKITYFNYPDICMAAINSEKKQLLVINGILNSIYPFDEIREDFVIMSFGENLGGGIIRLCKALNSGERLTKELLESLNVKEDEKCLEEFLD